MTIPFLKVILNLGRKQPPRAMERHHIMLAGISQTLFLKNWGEPDTQISLKKLGSLQQGTLYLSVDSEDDAYYSIWIYKERDRVLFFAKKKLIVHFKWSGFDERHKQLKRVPDIHGMRIPPVPVGKASASVA